MDAATKLCGNISAFGYWEREKTAVFDAHIVDTDQWSYQGRDPETVLTAYEAYKKAKYHAMRFGSLSSCLWYRWME